MTVRRVRLDNIRHISVQPCWFAEKWHNVISMTQDRVLVIHKRRGLVKNLQITPETRLVFKARLDRAIREVMNLPWPPEPAEVDSGEPGPDTGASVPAQRPSTGR
jgi:hypothetical protein